MFKDSLLVRTAQDEQSGLEPVAKKAIRRLFQHSIHELNFQPEVEVLAVQKGSVRSASQRTNGAWCLLGFPLKGSQMPPKLVSRGRLLPSREFFSIPRAPLHHFLPVLAAHGTAFTNKYCQT